MAIMSPVGVDEEHPITRYGLLTILNRKRVLGDLIQQLSVPRSTPFICRLIPPDLMERVEFEPRGTSMKTDGKTRLSNSS
jgi:hypothetical protein